MVRLFTPIATTNAVSGALTFSPFVKVTSGSTWYHWYFCRHCSTKVYSDQHCNRYIVFYNYFYGT